MKILFVAASYYPAVRYGGPIYTVHALARSLAARGHAVTVYTTNVDGDERIAIPPGRATLLDGVEVFYFRAEFARLYWSFGMISQLKAKAAEFDVIHAHAAFLYPTVAARLAARRAGVPFVYSPRGMLVEDLIRRKSSLPKRIWIRAFERDNCRHAAFVHATSDVEAREIAAIGLKPQRVEVVANGLDLDAGECDEAAVERRPAPDGLNWPYILILGRINWKKGIDRLVRAMVQVPDRRLVVAGNDDENHTQTLRALARDCGIQERVFFVGPAYGELKERWFRGADLFVLPSLSENFGVVVLEALAYGCPVIMTPEVGIAEEISHRGAAIVAEGVPETLAAAINGLLGSPQRQKALALNGRRILRESYSWPQIAARMEAAYSKCFRDARR